MFSEFFELEVIVAITMETIEEILCTYQYTQQQKWNYVAIIYFLYRLLSARGENMSDIPST